MLEPEYPQSIIVLTHSLLHIVNKYKTATSSISPPPTTTTAATTPTITTTTTTTKTLNDLPDDILLGILSLLPTKASIQTSIISRRWRHLWHRVPCLLFPEASKQFIHRTLILRPHDSPPVHKVFIQYESDYEATGEKDCRSPQHDLESWVNCAIHCGVQELELELSRGLRFPAVLTTPRGRVRVLRITLSQCCLKMPCHSPKSLTSLVLHKVELRDKYLSELVSGCVNLEKLCLDQCRSNEFFKVEICSVMLKELVFKFMSFGYYGRGCLVIDCPNLYSLTMINIDAKYDFKDISGLIEARVYFSQKDWSMERWATIMKLLSNVKHLAIQNWGIQLLIPSDSYDPAMFDPPFFYNLKHLEIETDYSKFDMLAMASLLALSPYLETIVLEQRKTSKDSPEHEDKNQMQLLLNKPVHFSLPSLKVEAIFISHLIQHGAVLEKIILSPPPIGEVSPRPPVILHREFSQQGNVFAFVTLFYYYFSRNLS
ncbi:hypothetical protein Tsubulata_035545, partial [Turnera subulata]